MCQYLAAGPIHHGRQIHEALRHWAIARVECPDLMGAVDRHFAQRVWPGLVLLVTTARVQLAVQRLNAHTLHQSAHVPVSHLDVFTAQQTRHHARSRERQLKMQVVDAAHQFQFRLYTTNSLESVNAGLPKIIKTHGHFPSDDAATKLLWLGLRNITDDWHRAARDWKAAMRQFAILYEDRFTRLGA
ncbi:transposase [Caballeronia sp. EK]|uniref:transposase n=1 Tax=Caballeronia sp. EK TaxID=2767469 RepID=UPI002815C981|nr:transposase [Caballeronia sp. EK]